MESKTADRSTVTDLRDERRITTTTVKKLEDAVLETIKRLERGKPAGEPLDYFVETKGKRRRNRKSLGKRTSVNMRFEMLGD